MTNLNLDDPRDTAMAETWRLLNGTAKGATAFILTRQQLREIRNLPTRNTQ